jgi:hypothetical protein
MKALLVLVVLDLIIMKKVDELVVVGVVLVE